ncbi:7977_t:CDS:2, partial [Acaulospora colombiana]
MCLSLLVLSFIASRSLTYLQELVKPVIYGKVASVLKLAKGTGSTLGFLENFE